MPAAITCNAYLSCDNHGLIYSWHPALVLPNWSKGRIGQPTQADLVGGARSPEALLPLVASKDNGAIGEVPLPHIAPITHPAALWVDVASHADQSGPKIIVFSAIHPTYVAQDHRIVGKVDCLV